MPIIDREARNRSWREWYARNHGKYPKTRNAFTELAVMTRQQVADALGVSIETVRLAEKSGLAKLRRALADWAPDACGS